MLAWSRLWLGTWQPLGEVDWRHPKTWNSTVQGLYTYMFVQAHAQQMEVGLGTRWRFRKCTLSNVNTPKSRCFRKPLAACLHCSHDNQQSDSRSTMCLLLDLQLCSHPTIQSTSPGKKATIWQTHLFVEFGLNTLSDITSITWLSAGCTGNHAIQSPGSCQLKTLHG